MTISNIFGWLTTAGDNDDLNGIPLDPNLMFPSHVNDAFQEAMKQVAGWRGLLSYPTAGGSANAITLTPSPAITANTGLFTFRAAFDNTSGTVTMLVSGVQTRLIRKIVGGADVALAVGDILDDRRYAIVYDATANAPDGAWILLNPQTVETSQIHFPASR